MLLFPLFPLYFLNQSPPAKKLEHPLFCQFLRVRSPGTAWLGPLLEVSKRCTYSVGQATLSSVGPTGGGVSWPIPGAGSTLFLLVVGPRSLLPCWQGLLQPLPPASSHMCDSGLSTWCSAVQESGGM